MSVLHQLQPSFNNGEISPLLYDRVDFKKFVSSVKSGKNMFVHPQGGMSNRAGTVMLAQAKQENVRLIPFEFSSTETYIIEFGNYYCRFYTADGQVVSGGQPYEIVSPFSTEDLFKIRYCQSGDVMYIAYGGKPKCLIREGHTNWHFEDYDFKNGPTNTLKEYNGSVVVQGGQIGFNWLSVGQSTGTSSTDLTSFCSDDFSSWSIFGDVNFMQYAKVCNGVLFTWNSNRIYYSLDGFSWVVLPNIPECSSTFSIKYNGSYYLLVIDFENTSDSKMYRFSAVDSAIAEVTPANFYLSKYASRSLRFVNNLFFILGTMSSGGVSFDFYYSSNGLNWTQANAGSYLAPDYYYIGATTPYVSISFLGNYYIFVDGEDVTHVYSTSWASLGTVRYPTGSGITNYVTRIAPKVAYNKIYIVALMVASGSRVNALYSFDGTNFVRVGNIQPFGLLFESSKKFVLAIGQTYELNSDNTLSSANQPQGYYFTNVLPFVVQAQDGDLLLSSNDYTFTEKDLNRKFNLVLNTDSFSISKSTSVSNTSTVNVGGGAWSLITSSTWGGIIRIEYSFDNETWDVYREYSSPSTSNPSNVNVSGYFDSPCFLRVSVVNVTGTIVYTFQCAGVPLSLYFYGTSLVSSSTMSITGEKESKPYVNFISNKNGKFYIGYWSRFDYYPQDVELYQDRIVWATNNQLDATKISDYENFGVSADVTEDDAISVIVKDKKVDRINSLIAGQKLAVYSDDGNFIHNNDTFTPNSATFLKQGATGGSDVKPVVVRDHIIYAHPMKQAVSDYAYNFETDGYAGQDITLLAHHLFNGKVIKTLAYQQEPYSIIWVLQEEGTVLACTYLRQQDVIAWTPMDFGGEVQSIAVCSAGTEENLYVAVKRKNGTFVEKMGTRLLSMDPKESFFVDCGRTYRGEPATVISGLDYLEGEEVVALADGNVVKDLTVENGSITLPHAASVVTVGLPYESVLETLTFDANTGDGSNLNRKKRVVAVSVRYNNSRGTRISVNGHREVDMLKREQEGYNIPISLKSGFYREIVASTHNEATTVKIRQDEPLPLTVVSVIPEIEYEK